MEETSPQRHWAGVIIDKYYDSWDRKDVHGLAVPFPYVLGAQVNRQARIVLSLPLAPRNTRISPVGWPISPTLTLACWQMEMASSLFLFS